MGHSYQLFTNRAKVTKSLSDTRWEAHATAVSAVKDNYTHIQDALSKLESNEDEKGETRLQARNILSKMDELEFLFMLELWNYILSEFHKTSKALQDPEISLATCANLYTSLSEFVDATKNMFDQFENEAKAQDPDLDYRSVSRRTRKRKRHFDEQGEPEKELLSPRDSFKKQSFDPIVDALSANLEKRATAYTFAAKTFTFLVDLNCTKEMISSGVQNIIQAYPQDVDKTLTAELKHFHLYVKQKCPNKETFTHQELLSIIFEDKIQPAFPNIELILRLFLSLMVTNCSGERSFSQLKRIKGDLRSTLAQEKLNAFSIMCIESDKLREVSFDDLIQSFAASKSRKKLF